MTGKLAALKRYTFAQIAKRECAECTTKITTTRQDCYYLVSDVEALLAEGKRQAFVAGAIWARGEHGAADERESQRRYKS